MINTLDRSRETTSVALSFYLINEDNNGSDVSPATPPLQRKEELCGALQNRSNSPIFLNAERVTEIIYFFRDIDN